MWGMWWKANSLSWNMICSWSHAFLMDSINLLFCRLNWFVTEIVSDIKWFPVYSDLRFLDIEACCYSWKGEVGRAESSVTSLRGHNQEVIHGNQTDLQENILWIFVWQKVADSIGPGKLQNAQEGRSFKRDFRSETQQYFKWLSVCINI